MPVGNKAYSFTQNTGVGIQNSMFFLTVKFRHYIQCTVYIRAPLIFFGARRP